MVKPSQIAAVAVVGAIGIIGYFLLKSGGISTAQDATQQASSNNSIAPRLSGSNITYYAPVNINETFNQTTQQYSTTVTKTFKVGALVF